MFIKFIGCFMNKMKLHMKIIVFQQRKTRNASKRLNSLKHINLKKK